MKKGQIMEGTVERVDFPNKGLTRTEEGTVTVKNTLPGQKIRFSISKKRNGRAEGRLLEVLQPSGLETRTPACGNFPACGGCTWQSMSYENQLVMKAGQVKRLLDPVLRAAGQEDWDIESEFCEVGQAECRQEPGMASTGIFEGIRRSPQEFRYRNKMEFSFGDEYKDGPLSLGLHKRGSHYDVLTVSDCQLVHPDMTAILTATLEFFRQKDIPYYHKMTHEGILRHLLLRRSESTGEILIGLVTAKTAEGEPGNLAEGKSGNKMEGKPADRTEDKSVGRSGNGTAGKMGDETEASRLRMKEMAAIWQDYADYMVSLRLEGRIAGILHMQNNSVADVVQSEQTTILYGQDYFYETLLGLRFKITPFSFFQTNSKGAEVLYSTAREFVMGKNLMPGQDEETERTGQAREEQKQEDIAEKKVAINCSDSSPNVIFDLYSGTGTIAQILAPIAKKVIGVEIVEEAVAAARENAVINGLDNCTFIAGDVLKVLDTIPDRPDFIVLDPPRDGIHPKALQKIIVYGAPRILYISCKPTSLARDLEVLLANGYQAERICCVDMFPQTANIETVCLLSKLHSKHHIEVELHMDEMDVTAAEKKATYEEIKAYVLEHSGLNVSNLYIAQIKQKYGIIERENYNKPKSENARQPQCPPEKEKAIVEALRHFKMIEGSV
ncbi:MAG: class I SAM-dependent RNA methyltransferase [Clostridiales bacterium]|nr:class I SAM-dependent RNA methyltransferase [Clostridiales bacterium]